MHTPDPQRPAGPPAGDPDPASSPTPPGSPSGTPSRVRLGLVGGAAAILAVAMVAPSLAAGPAAQPAATGISGALVAEGADHWRHGGFVREISIQAIDGQDVTLATADGWRRTITITDDVELTKGGVGIEVTDLAVGDQVRLAQERADDGTYTVTALAVVVPSVHGEVAEVTGTGFTVRTRDGSVWTIATDASTQYRYGTGDGTAADVTAGATVVVLGESTGDETLSATTVRVAPARVAGEVTAVSGSTITIETRSGTTVTVAVDNDTTFRVAGVEEASLDDIEVGMGLGAAGRADGDTSLEADLVVAGDGEGRGWFRGFDDDGRGPGGPFGGPGGPDDRFGGPDDPFGGFGPFGGDDETDPDASPSSTS